jgi:pyridoxine 4-dehydrogenase
MTNHNYPASAAGTITLGHDMTVNRLGYGAMRLTGQGIWGEPDDRETAKSVLHRALELDVTFIDTADAYGPNVNETLIAEALHPYADNLIIATKGGLTRSGPNQWHTNGKPDHLRDALDDSLKRLKVDTIDLYQFHRPDPEVPFEDSLGVFVEARDAGKVRHIGLSNVSVEQLQTALNMTEIASVQNRYNINDRTSEEVLQLCEAEGIAFIPWFPVGAGSLNENKTVSAIMDRHNASVFQIALAWLLRHSPVMLPIPGTSSVAHLEENIAAAGIELSDEDYDALTAIA